MDRCSHDTELLTLSAALREPGAIDVDAADLKALEALDRGLARLRRERSALLLRILRRALDKAA